MLASLGELRLPAAAPGFSFLSSRRPGPERGFLMLKFFLWGLGIGEWRMENGDWHK